MDLSGIRVAYVSAEIAHTPPTLNKDSRVPLTYSGGLGVLGGDTVNSVSDLPELKGKVAFFTLVYHDGFPGQRLDGFWQTEVYAPWKPADYGFEKLDKQVTVRLCGEDMKLGAWGRIVNGTRGAAYEVLIDARVEGNSEWHSGGTDKLYDSGGDNPSRYRAFQNGILGLGSLYMARALGAREDTVFHVNDPHGAFALGEMLKKYGHERIREIREIGRFTTHTLVGAGNDCTAADNIRSVLGDDAWARMAPYGSSGDSLSMFYLAANLSSVVNAVSARNAQVCNEKTWHDVLGITNGVHLRTWVSESMAEVYSKHFGNDWYDHPERFLDSGRLSLDAILAGRNPARAELVRHVNEGKGNAGFEDDKVTLVFARRAVPYKRAWLLFNDIDRLARIGKGRLQVIYAGKAHPSDKDSKDTIGFVAQQCERLGRLGVPAVFMEGYDVAKASLLVRGADVWLNTPFRREEASGTSGMKVAANGGVNFSILDGWWLEGHNMFGSENGWTIAPHLDYNDDRQDAAHLYWLLENEVLPAFETRSGLEKMLQDSMRLPSFFNTHRMALEYADKVWGIAHAFRR
ncbi:alpha-glucan family phosphorylase [Candidatus Woesearchaeota archaeon]|nr:alpha-glucan family phosphorylase [Candidatus Woesearchaeota archaeon]